MIAAKAAVQALKIHLVSTVSWGETKVRSRGTGALRHSGGLYSPCIDPPIVDRLGRWTVFNSLEEIDHLGEKKRGERRRDSSTERRRQADVKLAAAQTVRSVGYPGAM